MNREEGDKVVEKKRSIVAEIGSIVFFVVMGAALLAGIVAGYDWMDSYSYRDPIAFDTWGWGLLVGAIFGVAVGFADVVYLRKGRKVAQEKNEMPSIFCTWDVASFELMYKTPKENSTIIGHPYVRAAELMCVMVVSKDDKPYRTLQVPADLIVFTPNEEMRILRKCHNYKVNKKTGLSEGSVFYEIHAPMAMIEWALEKSTDR